MRNTWPGHATFEQDWKDIDAALKPSGDQDWEMVMIAGYDLRIGLRSADPWARFPHALRLGLIVSLCGGCMTSGNGFDNDSDEIAASELVLPHGARVGMFVTWAGEYSSPRPWLSAIETWACVEQNARYTTMEYRTTRMDGAVVVVAARFDRGGSVLAAWRGPEGTRGRSLEILGSPEGGRNEALAKTEEIRRSRGIPRPDVRSSVDEEAVETPAGTLNCQRADHTASLLGMHTRISSWHARDPSPLSQLVKFEDVGPWNRFRRTVLVEYGWEGATPTLRVAAE